MSDGCWLDRLPVELLHILFDYFSAHELFHTFHCINDHLDEVLRFYSAYRLNLQSIRKCDFDLVCRLIRPEQVISLTLSDGNDTPGLSRLFFSRFRIEQFTRIRSMTLIQIEDNSLESIITNLYQFNQLRALSINAQAIRTIQHLLRNLQIRHLKVHRCVDDVLEIILRDLLQLKSLDVNLVIMKARLALNVSGNRLIRLNLHIQSKE